MKRWYNYVILSYRTAAAVLDNFACLRISKFCSARGPGTGKVGPPTQGRGHPAAGQPKRDGVELYGDPRRAPVLILFQVNLGIRGR